MIRIAGSRRNVKQQPATNRDGGQQISRSRSIFTLNAHSNSPLEKTPTDPSTRVRANLLLPLVLIVLTSLAAVLPLFLRGPSCGHDFDFHLLSWLEVVHDWHHGLLNPAWLTTANYGAGEPRFIFYPPASWLLGAVLGGFLRLFLESALAWTLAPILFTLVALVFAGICSYFFALSLSSRIPATIAACLTVANPYLLFNAYERTAYGELLAAGFIALLLLFSLKPRLRIIPIALVVAALWLTNAPAAVMGCYTLAFVALLRTVIERRWLPALRAAAGCLLGCTLPAFYLVPAAWEQRWVQINRAVDPGMRIQDSFLFGHTGEAFHDQVLHTASLLAVLLLSIGFVAAIVAYRQITRRTIQRSSLAILTTLLGLILLLQFRFSSTLWNAAPHLSFLQFPWRWLLVAGIVSATLIALALSMPNRTWPTGRYSVPLQLGAGLLIAGVSICMSSRNFYQPCDDQDVVTAQLATFHDGSGVEGTDEYATVNGDNSEIQQDLPQVRLLLSPDADQAPAKAGDNPEWIPNANPVAPGTATVTKWEAESRQIQFHLPAPAFAILTLMDYPAWQITLNGHDIAKRPRREDGLIVLPIPAGDSNIRVRWSTTYDILWGRALSGIAILVALLIAYAPALNSRRSRPRALQDNQRNFPTDVIRK